MIVGFYGNMFEGIIKREGEIRSFSWILCVYYNNY